LVYAQNQQHDQQQEKQQEKQQEIDSNIGSHSQDTQDKQIFASLPLSPLTQSILASRNLTTPMQIQSLSIPTILAGHNTIIRAQTGTGKTLAYALPIIDKLAELKASQNSTMKGPYALILVPTRELANQVKDDMDTYAIPHGLTTLCMYGGQTSRTQQLRQLRQGTDILISTPGRIKDHLDTQSIDLINTRYAVLDEADEMFDLGFGPDVDAILLNTTAKVRQTILVSATMPKWVQVVASRFQKMPVLVDCVSKDEVQVPIQVKHYAVCVPKDFEVRNAIASTLIDRFLGRGESNSKSKSNNNNKEDENQGEWESVKRCILFTESQESANYLGKPGVLSRPAIVLHGGLSQETRDSRLARFKLNTVDSSILVATNIASRGLDIAGVDLVVQYSVPDDVENYVHRSGRTGRAGRNGVAIVLYSPEEHDQLLQVEQRCKLKFTKLKPTIPMIQNAINVMNWRMQWIEDQVDLLPWMDDEERMMYQDPSLLDTNLQVSKYKAFPRGYKPGKRSSYSAASPWSRVRPNARHPNDNRGAGSRDRRSGGASGTSSGNGGASYQGGYRK